MLFSQVFILCLVYLAEGQRCAVPVAACRGSHDDQLLGPLSIRLCCLRSCHVAMHALPVNGRVGVEQLHAGQHRSFW
jgi:hypothetical protein